MANTIGLRSYLDAANNPETLKMPLWVQKEEAACWSFALGKLLERNETNWLSNCKHHNSKKWNPRALTPEDFRMAKQTATYPIVWSNLLWFSGDRVRARLVLQREINKDHKPYDKFQLYRWLGYYIISSESLADEALEAALKYFQLALAELGHVRETWQPQKPSQLQELSEYLSLEEFDTKNFLAFYYAQAKQGEGLARAYAEHLKEKMKEFTFLRNNLLYHTQYLDTLGYVKLRFSRGSEEIRDAILLFQEAKIMAEKIPEHGERWATLYFIDSHLKEAESYL